MPNTIGVVATGIRVEPFETIMEFAPQAYYRLNEASGTIINSGSTAGRNGTGTFLTYGATKIPTRSPNTSISFAGTGLISVTDGVISGVTPQFSAGAWIKTSSVAIGNMHVLQQMNATSLGGFVLYITDGTILKCDGYTSAGVVVFSLAVSFVEINDNIPILIGMTVDATHMSLYGNGVRLGRTTRLAGTWTSTSDIFIGGDHDGTDDFTGTISDAFITTTVLDQHDWARVYRNGMLNGVSPTNDPWGSPISISGASGSQASVFTNASMDEDEPYTGVGGSTSPNSTWLRYTASGNRFIKFSSTGTGNHSVLLYRLNGADVIGNLTVVGSYDAFTTGALTGYELLDGGIYYLRVAGYQLATGTATISWLEVFPPANDHLAAAQLFVPTTASSAVGTNANSSIQDPNETIAGTLEPYSTWFKFQAATTGNITLHTQLTATDTSIAVWSGTATTVIGDLNFATPLAFDDDSGGAGTSLVTFTVISGTWYYVQISDYGGGAAYQLSWSVIT